MSECIEEARQENQQLKEENKKLKEACAMAVDWWLEEGKYLVEFGCPAWVFYCREPQPDTGKADGMGVDRRTLRETVAQLCHAQWAGWMEWMFEKVSLVLKEPPDPEYPETWIARWQRQMKTPYSYLSEQEKESDRREADKFIRLFQELTDKGQES